MDSSRGFKYMVTEPTRIAESSATIIDHCFLRVENKSSTRWECTAEKIEFLDYRAIVVEEEDSKLLHEWRG